ncbi:asparagine synthase (glutamine-hydrolyzing) [Ferruginibacter sp. HRS2-29]|uniref:asparagine synthase (glutamine-hydrolyzing) n=1 Tax=Ferruginibacter sp. HRS2-29 TaxID=2487334 RepID=UPI0020CE4584|nr:asparagine synthase (glutamine-hydrolyzing) [Ferruginibacter sp. HRS2-29]MCP9751950.1 asparagine synthase (glutamine-hydrolyzing) [Ferruginibacter sp. HRS2-29]
MCRIAGKIDRSIPFETIRQQVDHMCDLQRHGGPDGEGRYVSPEDQLVLGHRRLALIELSALGHQPMHYRDRYVITFNGEIYNYKELRTELKKEGYEFHAHSDTEVVLAAFARWNTQGFSRLQGMFAFALWDRQEKELFLVRDAAGIKPLYYHLSDTGLEFASEIRAFSYSGHRHVESKEWPVLQLAYGHIPEPVTTLSNVRPLHKGCFLKYKAATATTSLQSFSFYTFSEKITSRGQAVSDTKNNFEKAVTGHLLSDAPIGVFLSGGVDSSIITNIAAATQQEHLNTLSLYFNEEAFSEKRYQDILIEKLQCRSSQHLLVEQEFEASFATILDDMDMPSCDGINTWFISKHAAKQGLKAVLSGIGGDELFGGYPSFGRIATAKKLQRLPDAVLNAGKRNSNKRVSRLAYLQLEGIKGLYLFLRGQFTPIQIATQLGCTEKEVWDTLESTPVFPVTDSLAPKNEASWMEMNLYMQNQLLRDADVMSMAHGLEIRVPFLDDTLIRQTCSIAPEVKYAGEHPKQLLIDAFRTDLPDAIFNRKKMGFSFPFTEWLGNSEYVKELMAGSEKNTQLNYQKFRSGNLHWSNLMSLILLRKRKAA